jgi:hypothetical protein
LDSSPSDARFQSNVGFESNRAERSYVREDEA